MEKQNIFLKESLSLWLKDGISSNIPTLNNDIECDVCIVGAGITGITTAYRLYQAGLKVVLIDKQDPINLASGNTTGKFTFQHSLIYNNIINNYGEHSAKLYYEAQLEGLNLVQSLIRKYNIDCDLKETSSIIYAENDKMFYDILDEKAAYEKLDIPHELIYELPYKISGVGGLKVNSQFELNPVKYLDFLLTYLLDNKVSIFKDTEALTVDDDGEHVIVKTTKKNIIRCKNLVIATAYPFFDGKGFYYTRLQANKSYLLAYPITDPIEDNYMMISNSNSPYSLRFSKTDGINYLLIGGQGHKVGQIDSEKGRYNNLMNFAKNNFNVDYPTFRWTAQDYKAVDSIPFIGNITSNHKNVFVATGFNKWGMSNGSFAAILMTDLIMNKKSKYKEFFSPSRGEVKDNFGSFIKSNLNVAKELIKGKVSTEEIRLNDINNDQGGIINYNGKRVAAYRDDSGKIFLTDSTCTHLGCELKYNDADRSFDCPCHGSRFNYDGKVIEGPANTSLRKIE